ncbi:MAG: efflux transporter outer membrane subunit [Pseudomonadota bacterium]
MRAPLPFQRALVGAFTCALGACAVGPAYQAPTPALAAQFQASLPAPPPGQAGELSNWWRQFDDPLVAELVDAARIGNPGLERARARIARARAAADFEHGAQFPAVDLNLSAERSGMRSGTLRQSGHAVSRSIDALWEIDLFGAHRMAGAAASAQLEARTADFHAARVSLAAEVASTLVNYRACAATAGMLELDAKSRAQTAELTRLKIKAGFAPAAGALLIDASGADARQRAVAQRANCDLLVKALVALTDVAEPALRVKLDASARLPRPAAIAVDAVPATALMRRPDIVAAERELKAANAAIGAAEARRYPSLSLSGSIGVFRLAGASLPTDAWSILPALNLPLFDAGQRRADVSAAQSVYDENYAAYRQTVREAVRETEGALVRLDAAARRETDALAAARDYESYFKSSEERFKAGPLSLFELEDARRSALAAQQALIGVQQERVNAWIALYKALGGGWQDGDAQQARL